MPDGCSMDGIHHKFYTMQITVLHSFPHLLSPWRSKECQCAPTLQRRSIEILQHDTSEKSFCNLLSCRELTNHPTLGKGKSQRRLGWGYVIVPRSPVRTPQKATNRQIVNRLMGVNIGGSLFCWYADNRIQKKATMKHQLINHWIIQWIE